MAVAGGAGAGRAAGIFSGRRKDDAGHVAASLPSVRAVAVADVVDKDVGVVGGRVSYVQRISSFVREAAV